MSRMQSISRLFLSGLAPVTCALFTTLACSDGAPPDGGGGSSGASAGSSSAGSSSGGSGGSDATACRVGEPGNPDAAFMELAGTYTFRLLTSSCTVAGTTIETMRDYAVEVSEIPRAIRISLSPTRLDFTWDGAGDIVCEGDAARAIEIDGHGSLARASFIGDTPSALVVGACSGTLK